MKDKARFHRILSKTLVDKAPKVRRKILANLKPGKKK